MKASAVPWRVAASLLLLVHAATSATCGDQICAVSESTAGRAQPDTVSLLQSRGIHVEYSNETGVQGASDEHRQEQLVAASVEKAPGQALLLAEYHSILRVGSGWSTIIMLLLLLGLCWAVCALVGFARVQRKEDQLETRVKDVLQPRLTQEEVVQPPDEAAGAALRSPLAARLSPWSQSRSPGLQDSVSSRDLLPAMTSTSTLLANEMRLHAAKDNMFAAAKGFDEITRRGGDIMFLDSYSKPHIRATIRKVDGDLWLEVSDVECSSPSAMARLTNKDGPRSVPSFGTRSTQSPEIYGPDGSFYGILEISSSGAKLVSSTTALPVLDLGGDVEKLQLTMRTKSGIELATVSCDNTLSSEHGYGEDKLHLCIHKGNDPGLVIVVVVASLFSFNV